MRMKNLNDALIGELRDLLSVENQLMKELPKLARKARSDDLRDAIQHHLAETQQHAERLKESLSELDQSEVSKVCAGMRGIIEESEDAIKGASDEVIDAVIIAGIQKAEHYEIATYGTAIAWAELLGRDEVVTVLSESIEEEKAADEKLTKIAKHVNEVAVAV